MPNLEDVLREKTYKGQTETVHQRVFYTLNDGKTNGTQVHRNSKAIALLFERLHDRGVLSDNDLDAILLDVVP